MIIGRLIPAGTGLPRYRSLEPATPEGEQITIEPPQRDDRMILPVDVDESLSPIGSNFTDNVDKGTAEAEMDANPLVEELPGAKPSLIGRSADDLLRALFEAPLEEGELTDAELDEGDDETLGAAETLPPDLVTPIEAKADAEESEG